MANVIASEMLLANTTRLSNSTDLRYWGTLDISYGQYYHYCVWIYKFHVQNIYFYLTPMWQLHKMDYLCGSVVVTIQQVMFYLAVVIGIPGNILALLTILRFPRTTGTFYLALLSVSDWIALLAKIIHTLVVTFDSLDDVSCKVMTTLTSFTATYANWVLVLICFERLTSILMPLKKHYYFTKTRARLSAVLLAVILFPFFSVYLWNMTAAKLDDKLQCVPKDQTFHANWFHVTTVLYSYLPSLLMLVMVLLIWKALKSIQRNRSDVFGGNEGNACDSMTRKRLQEQARMENSITIMLLFASITFLILTLPLCVVIAVSISTPIHNITLEHVYMHLAKAVATGLVQLSHAVNFFIYFISTKRFRTHLLDLLRCSRLYTRGSTQRERSPITVEDQL